MLCANLHDVASHPGEQQPQSSCDSQVRWICQPWESAAHVWQGVSVMIFVEAFKWQHVFFRCQRTLCCAKWTSISGGAGVALVAPAELTGTCLLLRAFTSFISSLGFFLPINRQQLLTMRIKMAVNIVSKMYESACQSSVGDPFTIDKQKRNMVMNNNLEKTTTIHN